MNILDIIILLCMLPIVISGYKKGLIAQAISIASMLAGVWTAYASGGTVGEWIEPLVAGSCENPQEISYLAGFAGTLVISLIILGLIGKFIQEVLQWIIPACIDKPFGLILSIVNGALLLCTLYLLFLALNNVYFFTDFKNAFFADSLILPYIDTATKTILPDIITLFG